MADYINREKMRENKERNRKFVRYEEGAERYSMGLSKFQQVAHQAGAVYKVNKLVLVNTEILDEFLETCRITD